MKMMTSLALALLASAPVWAQDAEPSIATMYFEAYERMDLETMESLLAEDAVFTDRGSGDQPGGPYHYEGRAAIMAAMTSFSEQYGLYRIHYDRVMAYESSGQAVFAGEVEARWHRPDGQDNIWRGDVVTAIRVVDGQVIEHLDMPDYHGGTGSVGESLQ